MVNIFYPISAVSGIFQGMLFGSLVFISLLFITSLLFGRAFCGWLCPIGAVNELCASFIKRKATNERLSKIKYFLALLWFGEIVLELLRFFEILPVPTSEAASSMGESSMITFIILLAIPLAVVLGTRASCRYFCWFSPIMSIVTKVSNTSRFPALHLKVNRKGIWCNQCGICDDACPMGLSVSEMVDTLSIRNSECILCGACADACPHGVLSLSFGIPVKLRTDEDMVTSPSNHERRKMKHED
jgi:polyferredoxin